MDVARRMRPDVDAEEFVGRLRPRLEASLPVEDLEKVLRFQPSFRDLQAEAGRERGVGLTARDITEAMELVHDAAQSIRAAEDRVRDGEARTQALLQRATEELKSAESRVQAAEARARAAETRAQEADVRAKEAENWLRQIFSTISEELPGRR